MKLRALLAVVAIAATGTAFAATQTTTTTTRHHKVVKKVKKTHRQTQQHAAASRHHARRMGASSEHMSGSNATPDTDVNAGDRQKRVDEAYDKWRSTNR
jgi:Ni/Co efflux regulator RcnB